MSIRPVDFNGMIQQTHDVGAMKHNEDNKPLVEQQNLQIAGQQEEDQRQHQVQKADEKENEENRFDAREKGNNSYEENSGKRKKKKSEEEDLGDGKVILKGFGATFDMKI